MGLREGKDERNGMKGGKVWIRGREGIELEGGKG